MATRFHVFVFIQTYIKLASQAIWPWVPAAVALAGVAVGILKVPVNTALAFGASRPKAVSKAALSAGTPVISANAVELTAPPLAIHLMPLDTNQYDLPVLCVVTPIEP